MPRFLGRLFDRSDFQRLTGSRQKFAVPGLVLQVLPNATPALAGAHAEGRRVGFTASKKVGNAVQRNRAKRLRAAARDVMASHSAVGHDYVLVARNDTASCSYSSLLANLEAALKRLKVWREIATD